MQTEVQRYYNHHAPIYDITRWTMLRGRRKAVRRLELRRDSKVLEIGCGTGLNFRFVMARISTKDGHLLGLDFSEPMLRRAARRVAWHRWKNVELLQADASQISLNRTFDAVFFGYSLTMIPDWTAALERAHAHLRPGGTLVVLDYGRFESWGPLGAAIRWYQRKNHVDTSQPYIQKIRELFGEVIVEHWLGGYNFIASARKAQVVGPSPSTPKAGA